MGDTGPKGILVLTVWSPAVAKDPSYKFVGVYCLVGAWLYH